MREKRETGQSAGGRESRTGPTLTQTVQMWGWRTLGMAGRYRHTYSDCSPTRAGLLALDITAMRVQFMLWVRDSSQSSPQCRSKPSGFHVD